MNRLFAPDLHPLIHGPASDLLDDPNIIQDWVTGFGSPLHLMFPDQACKNYQHWHRQVADIYENTHIQFALKACKSTSLLRAMAELGAGADVASQPEMLSAFANLVSPSRMAMTGPSKTDQDIELAIVQGVTLHVDSPEEMKRILVLSGRYGQDIDGKLFLRLKPQQEPDSRFGMTPSQITDCLMLMSGFGVFHYGLSFHVNNYALDQRVTELQRCLRMAQELTAEGFTCAGIDIGGGFPMRYLAEYSESEFASGTHWQNKAKTGSYPYATQLSGAEFAAEVLKRAFGDLMLRAFAHNSRLKILMQPGRALLDQCGMTVLRVTDIKSLSDTQQIAILDGMSFSLSETWFGSDFAPEPIVLPHSHRTTTSNGKETFLAGRSCLESDMIRHRAITPPNGICAGDLVIFANTAGYQMDSNESNFHQLPLPRKMAVTRDAPRWLIETE